MRSISCQLQESENEFMLSLHLKKYVCMDEKHGCIWRLRLYEIFLQNLLRGP